MVDACTGCCSSGKGLFALIETLPLPHGLCGSDNLPASDVIKVCTVHHPVIDATKPHSLIHTQPRTYKSRSQRRINSIYYPLVLFTEMCHSHSIKMTDWLLSKSKIRTTSTPKATTTIPTATAKPHKTKESTETEWKTDKKNMQRVRMLTDTKLVFNSVELIEFSKVYELIIDRRRIKIRSFRFSSKTKCCIVRASSSLASTGINRQSIDHSPHRIAIATQNKWTSFRWGRPSD